MPPKTLLVSVTGGTIRYSTNILKIQIIFMPVPNMVQQTVETYLIVLAISVSAVKNVITHVYPT